LQKRTQSAKEGGKAVETNKHERSQGDYFIRDKITVLAGSSDSNSESRSSSSSRDTTGSRGSSLSIENYMVKVEPGKNSNKPNKQPKSRQKSVSSSSDRSRSSDKFESSGNSGSRKKSGSSKNSRSSKRFGSNRKLDSDSSPSGSSRSTEESQSGSTGSSHSSRSRTSREKRGARDGLKDKSTPKHASRDKSESKESKDKHKLVDVSKTKKNSKPKENNLHERKSSVPIVNSKTRKQLAPIENINKKEIISENNHHDEVIPSKDSKRLSNSSAQENLKTDENAGQNKNQTPLKNAGSKMSLKPPAKARLRRSSKSTEDLRSKSPPRPDQKVGSRENSRSMPRGDLRNSKAREDSKWDGHEDSKRNGTASQRRSSTQNEYSRLRKMSVDKKKCQPTNSGNSVEPGDKARSVPRSSNKKNRALEFSRSRNNSVPPKNTRSIHESRWRSKSASKYDTKQKEVNSRSGDYSGKIRRPAQRNIFEANEDYAPRDEGYGTRENINSRDNRRTQISRQEAAADGARKQEIQRSLKHYMKQYHYTVCLSCVLTSLVDY